MKNRYLTLRERAATGNRTAARQLILEGYEPQGWDADDPATIDTVIERARKGALL